MSRKLKMGLLGCGPIAQIAHLAALRKAENVEFTAICDVAEDLLNAMADRYSVADRYTDHNTFLEKADIDAVLERMADLECWSQDEELPPRPYDHPEDHGWHCVKPKEEHPIQCSYFGHCWPNNVFADGSYCEHRDPNALPF